MKHQKWKDVLPFLLHYGIIWRFSDSTQLLWRRAGCHGHSCVCYFTNGAPRAFSWPWPSMFSAFPIFPPLHPLDCLIHRALSGNFLLSFSFICVLLTIIMYYLGRIIFHSIYFPQIVQSILKLNMKTISVKLFSTTTFIQHMEIIM